MARPKKGEEHPREKLRPVIMALAGHGMPHADIASTLGVGTDTLHKFYKDELDGGALKLKTLALSKYTEAMQGGEQWALKLFLSSRMGISDKLQLEGGDPEKPIRHEVVRKVVRPGDVPGSPAPQDEPQRP